MNQKNYQQNNYQQYQNNYSQEQNNYKQQNYYDNTDNTRQSKRSFNNYNQSQSNYSDNKNTEYSSQNSSYQQNQSQYNNNNQSENVGYSADRHEDNATYNENNHEKNAGYSTNREEENYDRRNYIKEVRNYGQQSRGNDPPEQVRQEDFNKQYKNYYEKEINNRSLGNKFLTHYNLDTCNDARCRRCGGYRSY